VSRIPPYFDFLIEGFRRGLAGRHVHLGYWPEDQDGRQPAELEFDAAQQRLDERVLALAQLQDGQRVLDVGCGFGGTLARINSQRARMALVGVNVDPRQLSICAEIEPQHDNRLDWQVADACALPFADASFERVLCVEAMFHFASRQRTLAEAARVLAPGGALVGTDMLVAPAARALDRGTFPIERAILDGYGPWPDFWASESQWRRHAEAAGLRCEAWLDISDAVRPSHRFTTPADADVRDVARSSNTALRAALMLRWLHEQGHLRYIAFRFDKPGNAR
jgi:SAM-dependent methyltransferase